MAELQMKDFWKTLEDAAVHRVGDARTRIKVFLEAAGNPPFEDFIRANVGTEVLEPELPMRERPKQEQAAAQPAIPEFRIRAMKTVTHIHAACRVLLGTGWDYTDPRHLMHTPPEGVSDYLSELLDDRDSRIEQMSDGRRRLLETIIASWIAWAKVANMRATA